MRQARRGPNLGIERLGAYCHFYQPEEDAIGYTIAELNNKIMEMYPEIAQYGVESSLILDHEKKT